MHCFGVSIGADSANNLRTCNSRMHDAAALDTQLDRGYFFPMEFPNVETLLLAVSITCSLWVLSRIVKVSWRKR